MFTGIIAAVGQIMRVAPLSNSPQSGVRLDINAVDLDLSDVALGDSIALNGACMTVVALDVKKNTFAVDVSHESLSKTSSLDTVGYVNLEKAMRLSDRLGGHLVSGHVDDVARIVSLEPVGESYELIIAAPVTWRRFVADKGSVTIHGTSLTANRTWVDGDEVFVSINLIPHTIRHTVFQYLKAGDRVNLEIDLLARYIAQLLPNPNESK
ncbi:riboflavin synthase [Hydromonas duriensis]|uniref:Riboflavin synthase n=1 Tax=Hydromonas duriensis TaxID=1527608 RepID=A0A4R6YA34_9BURK|nr:riboflavin synthase [Hydromonas duriensis]TDR32392.1 riboflavin synthase alpha chain [Hydromonas duriensis]